MPKFPPFLGFASQGRLLYRSAGRGRRAFTLVEVLIAIAVIAILVAVLLPVVGTFKKRSDSVSCTSSLRALAVASRAYGLDHGGRFPSTSLYNSDNHSRPGVQTYLDAGRYSTAYRCPSLKDYPFSEAYILPGTNLKGCTYTVSLATSSNANGGTYALEYFQKVQMPMKTAWIMDGAWNVSYFDTVISPNNLATGLARLQYPHGQRQNVVFVDGHIESLNVREIPTDPTSTFWTGL